MPLSEAQSKWYAKYLTGDYALPTEQFMHRFMEREQKVMAKRYVQSARHTMQVDFELFLAELEKESRQGQQRARKQENQLNVLPLAHNYPETRTGRSSRASGRDRAGRSGGTGKRALSARR